VRSFSQRRNTSVATAIAAYRQLEDGGYIEAKARSGFFVRSRPKTAIGEPGISKPRVRPSPVTGQELALQLVKAANDPDVVQLGAAVPDPSFLPTQAIERAFSSAVRQRRVRSVSYEFPPGSPELRRQIARRMGESGCSVHPDEIVITNGCQEALTLALRTVTKPGDVVAIESPTFYGLLQVIDSLGLEALEIPTHPRDGISLEALQLALEQWPVKACIAVPNYSNPLGYCMPEESKQRLVDLLKGHRVALIEDDVYGDLGFSQHRPSTCKARDTTGTVLYCASFSKSLSPGLRVGWILPGRYQEKVEYLKYVTSLATSTVPQLVAAHLLESGAYERHLRKARVEYARAVELMVEAVDRYFPEGTKVTRPQGGFVIWVELAADLDSFELSRKLLARGISIAPGPIFSASQKYRNFLRLSCACKWSHQIEKALASIARMI
jgi:DNA-binding transcriptional MocR family regulator